MTDKTPLNSNLYNSYIDYLSKWIKEKVEKANAKGVILGLSGGIDSSVVSFLAKKTFPENHLVLIMPFEKNNMDYKLAIDLVKNNNIKYKEINIKNIVESFFHVIKEDDIENLKLLKGNLIARIRMTLLYFYAQLNNYLVLGTDNACEWYIGYFTKFGDGAADMFPIIRLLKSDVKEVAKILKIDNRIINRDPTASLWEGQTDEGELGFTYLELENFMSNKQMPKKEIRAKIEKLNSITNHKRQIGDIPTDLKK